MKKLLNCRRSVLALFAITALTVLGFHHGKDISGIAIAISGIVGSVAASNSWENRSKNGK